MSACSFARRLMLIPNHFPRYFPRLSCFLTRKLLRLTATLSAGVDITQRSGIESALNLAKLGMRGQLSAADVVAVAEKTLTDGCAT